MSRKRVEPKTPLGKRLSEVREALKFDEREPFAEALGISVAMLGYYERGDRVPDAEVLATFSLVMWPVRVHGLKLVRHNGVVSLWTSSKGLRFVADAREAIIEAATAEARKGLEGLMWA